MSRELNLVIRLAKQCPEEVAQLFAKAMTLEELQAFQCELRRLVVHGSPTT